MLQARAITMVCCLCLATGIKLAPDNADVESLEHVRVADKPSVKKQKVDDALNQRAIADRTAAQRAASESHQDPSEGLGDINMADVMDTLTKLNDGLKHSELVAAFNRAINDMKASASELAKDSAVQLAFLVKLTRNASAQETVLRLANFFRSTKQLLKDHAQECNASMNTLKNSLSKELQDSIQNISGMMGDSSAAELPFDANLSSTPAAEVCPGMTEVMSWVYACSTNTTKMKTTLNSTAAMLPMLGTMMPELSAQLTTTLTDLLDLGYLEATVMADAAWADIEQLTPLINHKLHCSVHEHSGAAGRAGQGLHGLLAALLALAVASRLL